MMIVPFDLVQLFGLWTWAEQAYARKRTMGVGRMRSDNTAIDIASGYIGLRGEYAVALAFDLPVNLDITKGGDGGVDLRWRDQTIDVKTMAKNLIFNRLIDFRADITVLVQPYGNRPDPFIVRPTKQTAAHAVRDVCIRGWISRAEFQERHQVRDFGFGPKVWVRADGMRPIEELQPPDLHAVYAEVLMSEVAR